MTILRAARAVSSVRARSGGVEVDLCAAACLPVEDEPLRYGGTEHLLQGDCLSAELDLVRAVRLGPSAFVLDRDNAAAAIVELYRVCDPCEPQAGGA